MILCVYVCVCVCVCVCMCVCVCVYSRGWEYVEESELGTVVALNVGGKVVPRNYDLVCVCRAEAVWQACLSYEEEDTCVSALQSYKSCY